MKKLIFLVALILCAAVLMTACGPGEDGVVTLSAGNNRSAEDPSSLALFLLAERAYELSDGTLNIEVFIASQTGSAITQLEALSLGSQAIYHGGGTWISNYVPDRAVASLFFLFDNEEHFLRYLRHPDLGAYADERFREELGIIMLGHGRYSMAAPRSMVANVPIHSLSDFEGLRFRTPDIRAFFESFDALGVSPVQLALGEVYLGLLQGTVDGTCAPFDGLYTMNFFEAAPYVLITDHAFDNYPFMINENIFNSLSDSHREALLQATYEATLFFNAKNIEMRYIYMERMVERGATIIHIDREEFAAATQARMRELEAEGLWRQGLIEEILALR